MRAATTSINHGKVTGKRRGDNLCCVPGEVGVEWCDRRNGRFDQIVRREERGVVAPEEGGRKSRRERKGDDKSIMITLRARSYGSVHFEVDVTAVSEYMVDTRMHGNASVMEGKVRARRTKKSGIVEGGETRLKAMPGWRREIGGGGRTVLGWIRVRVPVSSKEVERGEIGGVLCQGVKEMTTCSPVSRSIDGSNGKGPPPVTESR